MITLVTVVAAVLSVAAAQQSTVEVTLQQGVILGSQEEATNGGVYYRFRSIPYARPPIGPLRLKDPEPAPAWNGVRNGSLPIPKCPQFNLVVPGKIEGQEDCLYLNVYTPTLHSSNLPVMVHIHGGGFIFGSAEEYLASPELLMQKDIVMVAMNYRLGALGFLSTGDSVLSGNMGLKDQNLALRWVQDNIRDFGGDPNKVTIFGVSAGGMSAHFHVVSPASAGLFQRAILQSGTALLFGYNIPPRESAISISKALNCTSEGSNEILACFMETSVEDMVKVPSSLAKWLTKAPPLGPCVDGTFLPDHPAALMKNGLYNKVDLMSGATKDEGNLFTIGLFSKQMKQPLQQLNNNFSKYGPIMLLLTEEENPVYLARHLILKDVDDNTDFNMTLNSELALTKLVGDRYFQTPSIQAVEFHAKDPSIKTFMYEFNHCSEKSAMSIIMNATQERKMAGHGDDMMFLFEFSALFEPLSRQEDLYIREILVTLWTNFASTGNPTINGTLGFRWSPIVAEEPIRYLSITANPTMQTVDSRNREFWNSLPTKNNKLLYPERFLEDEP